MKRRTPIRVVSTLAILAAAGTAAADVVGPAAPNAPAGVPGAADPARADCTLGTTEPSPAFEVDAVSSFFECAYLVDPADFNCCDTGFAPETITYHLRFVGFGDLYSYPVQVAVVSAEPVAGGYVPGADICATPFGWILNADITGLYAIELPPYVTGGFGDLKCPCLDSGIPYFVVGRILAEVPEGAEPDAVRDSTPLGGRTFVRQNGGPWQDVVADLGWAGEVVMSTDVACCNEPVTVDESTWGRVKALYR